MYLSFLKFVISFILLSLLGSCGGIFLAMIIGKIPGAHTLFGGGSDWGASILYTVLMPIGAAAMNFTFRKELAEF